jgi:hypothetical protein
VSLFFRPSVALYYEFVLGRTEPCRAQLICGPDSSGFSLGVFDVVVDVPTKRVLTVKPLPKQTFTAKHGFDCLSYYSYLSPAIQLACADTRRIKPGELFTLSMLLPEEAAPYEQDLQKVISA